MGDTNSTGAFSFTEAIWSWSSDVQWEEGSRTYENDDLMQVYEQCKVAIILILESLKIVQISDQTNRTNISMLVLKTILLLHYITR